MNDLSDIQELLDKDIRELFTFGGDSRMHIDPENGMNKYGCAPEPRDVFALSSCTASSPSPRAYGAATEMKYWLKLAAERGDFEEAVDVAFKRLRSRLLRTFGLHNEEDIAVALTPSGTDVEILASALALDDRPDSHLCNIVAAPLEVGSGTVLAAGALNFDPSRPRANLLMDVGEPIADSLANRIDVTAIRLRNPQGEIRTTADLDEEVASVVRTQIANGNRILLHVVAHSKTGAHAPSLRTVKQLKAAHPDNIDVIIDAAQGRISRHGFADAIKNGYMVLFTGSKFFSGPPFSGALFIPRSLWPTSQAAIKRTAEAAQYFGAFEMPTSWPGVRELLPNKPNIGLILRWTAAMAEVEAYYKVSEDDRRRVLESFEPIIQRTLLASDWISGVNNVPDMPSDERRLLESNTTVISFMLRRAPHSKQYFNADELRQIYHWLNQDMSSAFDGLKREQALAVERSFQIGQPVLLSPEQQIAVLRVALGSANVVTIVGNNTFGPNFEGRMLWFEHQCELLRIKLELIARDFDRLQGSKLQS